MRTALILALVSTAFAQRGWVIERPRMATILFGVSFYDSNNGIVTGGANGRGNVVFRTRDGGNTYTIVPSQGHAPPGASMFLSGFIQSDQNAVAAGLCSWCFDSSGIQYTHDGARFQFADDNLTAFPPVAAAQGGDYVKNVRTGEYAFVGAWGTGRENTGIRHSVDNGVTWRHISLPERLGQPRYMSMPSSNVWYVTYGAWPRVAGARDGIMELSENVAVFTANGSTNVAYMHTLGKTRDDTGYDAVVYKTVDGGYTFTPVLDKLSEDYYFNNIDCYDVNNCVVVGEGRRVVAFRTADGGRTWTELDFGLDGRPSVMDVRFLRQRELFVAGAYLRSQTQFDGFVLQSTNNGASWVRHNIEGANPVALSMYVKPDGTAGGHGVALTPDGLAATIKSI